MPGLRDTSSQAKPHLAMERNDASGSSSRELREAIIRLPGIADGYSRVMLVGTTGAGKTTLLRHLIGSDHRRDRFPSTSAAKTTIAEIEIVTAAGAYEAVVTFTSHDEAMADVEDCIDAACETALRGADDDRIAEALLEHREQRFRLSYLLGGWQPQPASDRTEEDDLSDYCDYDDEADDDTTLASEEIVDAEEIRRNQERLRTFVEVIRRVSNRASHDVATEYGAFAEQDNPRDRTEWIDDLFTPELKRHDDYFDLVSDIMDEIEDRFSLVRQGTFEASGERAEWPAWWRYTSADRDAFLSQVRWFSSNHHQQFGRLLTPLVDGVRVRGPLFPARSELQIDESRLVILDGEGLGHSSEEASSISTKITERFREVDLILLVDSAAQPMQAAPLQLLRAVGTSGHGEKLAVAFTHFDQVKGDNLRSFDQRGAHVRASINNALASLQDHMTPRIIETLSARLEVHVFFLGALDRAASRVPPRDVEAMRVLMHLMRESGRLPEATDLLPVYEFQRFELALNDATDDFKMLWAARLGLQESPEVEREHWARIKALCRRLGIFRTNEYKHLRPAGDLISHLQGMISNWLDNPVEWSRPDAKPEEEEAVLDQIRQSAFQRIHDLADKWLVGARIPDWEEAYDYSGRGSTRIRARHMMDKIYEAAAPKIRARSDERMEKFREAIIDVVREAIEDVRSPVRQLSPPVALPATIATAIKGSPTKAGVITRGEDPSCGRR